MYDRSISLGSPLHSLATADLKPHYILPMDDELFDIGVCISRFFLVLLEELTRSP
jgi:hypothetical protein